MNLTNKKNILRDLAKMWIAWKNSLYEIHQDKNEWVDKLLWNEWIRSSWLSIHFYLPNHEVLRYGVIKDDCLDILIQANPSENF